MDKNARKICVIKTFQKVYFEQFGEKLVIDFAATKGIEEEKKPVSNVGIREMQRYFNKVVKKHNASKKKILSTSNLGAKRDLAECRALKEFSAHAVQNGWDMSIASKVIKRQRTGLYHMAKDWKNNG